MTATPGHKSDTRKVLIDAALEVFLQRGFARATTREIAQRAGLAEGTMYRHFADKYDLFHQAFLSLTRDIGEELKRFPERAGLNTVRENLECLFSLVGQMQAQVSSLMASMWADPELARSFNTRVQDSTLAGFERPEPVAMVADYIRAEQELGRVRRDIDAAEAAVVVVSIPFASGMQQALSTHFAAQGDLPAPESFPPPATGALDILAKGLAP
jgi:AcrR family transcriptional regulator